MKYLIIVRDHYLQEIFVSGIHQSGDTYAEHSNQSFEAVCIERDCFSNSELKKYLETLQNSSSPIITSLLLKAPFLPSHFLPVKDEFSVDYILPMDIKPDELQGFLSTLKGEFNESEFDYRPSEEHLERYKNNIFNKIEGMWSTIVELELSYDLEKVRELRMDAHKIAGSAAAYGYEFLGDVCRQFDRYLSDILNHPDEKTKANFDQICRHIMRKMSFAFQKIQIPLESLS